MSRNTTKTDDDLTFGIYCMSYKRSSQIKTLHLLEYCTYVVRQEEEELYRAAGVTDLLVIPEGEAWSFMSTLYWIIAHTPEDVIYVVDDDLENYCYRIIDRDNIVLKDGTPDKETITAEIERIAQLIADLDIGLAFDQNNVAQYVYHEEFKFMGIPAHMRWINKKALKAKYDKDDPAASDVDMMMQELLYNRVVLQPRYFVCLAHMDTNEGAYRTRHGHLVLIDALRNKWGKYYDYNHKRNIPIINVKR